MSNTIPSIPATFLAYVFTRLDYDLYLAEKEDFSHLSSVEEAIAKIRQTL